MNNRMIVVAMSAMCAWFGCGDEVSGTPDAGTPDAGTPDAGTPDADMSADAVSGDGLPPTVRVRFPPSTCLTDRDTIAIRGAATSDVDIASIQVNGVAATSDDGFATWEAMVPLAAGHNDVAVQIEDVHGDRDPMAAQLSVTRCDLSKGGCLHVGTGPEFYHSFGIAWDAVERRVLLLTDQPGAVMALNPDTGERTIVSGGDIGLGPAIPESGDIALDGFRHRVLVPRLDDDSALLAVETGTGDRAVFSDGDHGSGPPLTWPRAVTVDVVRERYISTETDMHAIFAIDPDTGDRTVITSPTVGTGPIFDYPTSVAVDGGRYLVVDPGSSDIFTVDAVTGNRAVLEGTGPSPNVPISIVVQQSGVRAQVLSFDDRRLLSIDLVTGARTVVFDDATGHGPKLLEPDASDYDPVNRWAFINDNLLHTVFVIDVNSGDSVMVSYTL